MSDFNEEMLRFQKNQLEINQLLFQIHNDDTQIIDDLVKRIQVLELDKKVRDLYG